MCPYKCLNLGKKFYNKLSIFPLNELSAVHKDRISIYVMNFYWFMYSVCLSNSNWMRKSYDMTHLNVKNAIIAVDIMQMQCVLNLQFNKCNLNIQRFCLRRRKHTISFILNKSVLTCVRESWCALHTIRLKLIFLLLLIHYSNLYRKKHWH